MNQAPTTAQKSPYHKRVDTISDEVSQLHEKLTVLCDKMSVVLKSEEPSPVCERSQDEPGSHSQIENFLDETASSIERANIRLSSLIERCVL